MPAKPTLTVILPAHNEEGSLEATCENVLASLVQECRTYEILIIDDGSTDSTGAIAQRMAAKNPAIRLFRNEPNRGIGYTIRRGIGLASMEYVMYWSAGTEMTEGMLRDMLARIGDADMIIPYIANPGHRGLDRRFLSAGYTTLVNLLFGLRLRYFNGTTIYPTPLVQSFLQGREFACDDYAFMAELLIRMMRNGATFVEVPTRHHPLTEIPDQRSIFKRILRATRSVARLYFSVTSSGRADSPAKIRSS